MEQSSIKKLWFSLEDIKRIKRNYIERKLSGCPGIKLLGTNSFWGRCLNFCDKFFIDSPYFNTDPICRQKFFFLKPVSGVGVSG